MKLHHPASSGIFPAKEEKQHGLKPQDFFLGKSSSAKALFQNHIGLLLGCRSIHDIIKAVVRNHTAHRVKKVKTNLQRLTESRKAVDLYMGNRGKLFHVSCKIRLLNGNAPVRAPCGKNLNGKALIFCDRFVITKRINGVIGSTDQRYVGFTDQASGAHILFCKLFVAKLPYLGSSVLA